MVEGFYLPRIDSTDLSAAVAWMFHAYDSAPRLCGWLADALMAEQTRRLRSRQGEVVETQLLAMPAAKWSSYDIGQALAVVTVLSYAVKSYGVGVLVDWLVKNLVAASNARLATLEERCRK